MQLGNSNLWKVSTLLGLQAHNLKKWSKIMQFAVLAFNLFSLLVRCNEAVFKYVKATDFLPLLYNFLTLIMASNYTFFVLTKSRAVQNIFKKQEKIGHQLAKSLNEQPRVFESYKSQYFVVIIVVPLALFDAFSCLYHSTLLLNFISAAGHCLCLLNGTLLEQQFVSCMLACKFDFKLLNKKLKLVKWDRTRIIRNVDFEIRELQKIHLKLLHLFNLIGDTFQGILLAQVIYSSLAIICLLYFIVSTALSPQISDGTWQALLLVNGASWLILLAVRLVFTSWISDSSIKEANASGPLLQKIKNQQLSEAAIKEIDAFSAQILQSNISLSLFGFVELNLTILHTIAGTATTYLVILIQFQSPSN